MSILDYFKRRGTLLRQISRLRAENRQIKQRTSPTASEFGPAVGSAPVYLPQEDFAYALGSAVDSLQTHMAQMSNPVSDFAVREVSLQAKVSLEVTPLGTLAYRFVNPSEGVDASTLSSLALTIVPVPKLNGAGAPDLADLDAQVGVEHIPGLGERRRERLRRHDIYTVGEFLRVGTRARSAVQLAALLEVDRLRLSEWLTHAQLLMLQGVDGPTASVLHEAGIRGFDDLASLAPAEVSERFERQAAKSARPTLRGITPAQAESWVKTARAYTGRTTLPV